MFTGGASRFGRTTSMLAFGKHAIKLEVKPGESLNGHSQEFIKQAGDIFAKAFDISPNAGDTVELRATQAEGKLEGLIRINGKGIILTEGYGDSFERLIKHGCHIALTELDA
jgi:hypothetical protein